MGSSNRSSDTPMQSWKKFPTAQMAVSTEKGGIDEKDEDEDEDEDVDRLGERNAVEDEEEEEEDE